MITWWSEIQAHLRDGDRLTLVAVLAALIAALIVAMFIVRVVRRKRPVPRQAFVDGVRSWHRHERRPSEAALRQVLAADPDHFEAVLMLGHLLRRRGEVQRALLMHRQLLARQRLSGAKRASVLAACVADALAGGRAAGDLTPWIDELLALDPKNSFGLRARVEALRQAGELRQALRAFRAAEDVYWSGRDAPSAIIESARARREALFFCREGNDLIARDRFKEAARVLNTAVRRDEMHPAPHLGLAALAEAEGKTAQAVRHLRRAALLGAPELALKELADLRDPHADEATVEVARHVLGGDPDHRGARRAWIRVSMRNARFGRPGELIDEALVAGDRSAWMIRMQALLALRQGDTAQAIEVLESEPDQELLWQCSACLTIERSHAWRCHRCGDWETLDRVELPGETGSRDGADIETVRATAGR